MIGIYTQPRAPFVPPTQGLCLGAALDMQRRNGPGFALAAPWLDAGNPPHFARAQWRATLDCVRLRETSTSQLCEA
jgi:hypothetical protein